MSLEEEENKIFKDYVVQKVQSIKKSNNGLYHQRRGT